MKQDHKSFEHIVIDGASTDNTINVLRSYENKYPLKWISRPDGGQSEALNQGLSMAKGDIIGWLNADDMYMPKALGYIAEHFKNQPEKAWLYGNSYWTEENRCVFIQRKPGPFDLKKLICCYQYMDQPSVFFRRHVPEIIGGIDNQLHYTMDYDFIIRMGIRFPGDYINKTLSAYRLHANCKLMSQQTAFGQDALYTLAKTFSNPDLPNRIRRSENQAYSYCYFLWGSKALAAGHYKFARHWLINALKRDPYPWKPKNLAAIVAILDMFLRINRYKPLEFTFKRQQRKFRNRHKNMRIDWFL
ncbi:family 2 glycosyl transferase [Candidatus Magnetomorum sp. HK-1]|nr:family 2 glycosyl transferase [Candidatus Magnetomorum sp. HK-1]